MKKISNDTKNLLIRFWNGPTSYRGIPKFEKLEKIHTKITNQLFKITEKTKGSAFESDQEMEKASQSLIKIVDFVTHKMDHRAIAEKECKKCAKRPTFPEDDLILELAQEVGKENLIEKWLKTLDLMARYIFDFERENASTL